MDTKYKMLKIYLGESSKYKGKTLYPLIVMKLKKLGLEGVTVIRAIEGYGKSKKLHNMKILDLSSDLPIIIEAIDTDEKINNVIPEIQKIAKDKKIVTIDVNVIWYWMHNIELKTMEFVLNAYLC